MNRFLIDSSFLGSSKHIIGDHEGFILTETIPRDAWHLTGNFKNNKCLDTLLRLNGNKLSLIPEKYRNAISCVTSGSQDVNIPWRYVLPSDEFKIFFKNTVGEISNSFSNLPFDYYEKAWMSGSRVLASLRTAKIDLNALNEHIAKSDQVNPALESFKPKRSGFSRPITYDRFATRTGRLTVTDGPNILILKKDYRDIISSSWAGGTICYLDFRALEARIVLAESGRYSDEEDLYDDIAKKQFCETIPRDIVKTAILSKLYGISRSALKTRLGISDIKLDGFIGTLEEYFGIDSLNSKLRNEHADSGLIRNRFGRPLQVPGGQDNLLINTYAQSTGVDVSMIGFDGILQKLGTDGIRPLFVLHDAIILDVHPDRLCDVEGIKDIDICGYEKNFPIKFEKVF